MKFTVRFLFKLALVAILQIPGNYLLAQSKPNVVFIMTDDAGYGDIGVYGASDISTPNLDNLAHQGVRLTDFYSNGPTCSPTRAALMSGRYQQHFGIERPITDNVQSLPVEGYSLPQLLKDNGYKTALYGKWHLGQPAEQSPNAHGFDEFFGFKGGYIDHYRHSRAGVPDLWENDRPIEVEGYMTDLITERSVGFIKQSHNQPFFLSVQFNAPHWPYQRPDDPTVARNNTRHVLPYMPDGPTREDYVAMFERVDSSVGRIVQALEEAGVADNTLVIFTNDNGGEWLSRNEPFFHRKGGVWEAGIRVPAIFYWPGRIPQGRVSDQVGITMDITSTILAVTGSRVPEGVELDGMNLLPVLEGEQPEVERTLFWRTQGSSQQAVRKGNWKLVVDGRQVFLYDLRLDLGERHDMAGSRQEVVRELWQLLGHWAEDIDAEARARGVYKAE